MKEWIPPEHTRMLGFNQAKAREHGVPMCEDLWRCS
jgi:hypothetical protein